jgi:hypothetical protein
MTEQEVKPLIVQLYTELLTRLHAEALRALDEDEIAEGAEMLANQFILGVKEADELDELLSLSPEEIRGLFINADFSKLTKKPGDAPAFVFAVPLLYISAFNLVEIF